MTKPPTVLWTVRMLDHEYQVAIQGLEDGACELRLIRDGVVTFAERWSSEQGAIEESERYRELVARWGPPDRIQRSRSE